MADEIRCPMCGKSNPAELDVCQYCEARLKPLTDELAHSQPPIHPGEEPTNMDTDQLEPVLPEWLREIRQQARETDQEGREQAQAEDEAQQEQAEETNDRLAGLQSQSQDEEEIPDWLSGLRGEGAEVGFEETSTEEDDLVALKSMLGEEAPSPQESDEGALRSWMSDLGTGETEQAEQEDQFTSQTEEPAQPSVSSSDFDWSADFEAESGPQTDSTQDQSPMDTELPARLQGEEETAKEEMEGGLPAWMSAQEPSPDSPSEEVTHPAGEGDLPDWLASLGEEESGVSEQQDAEQPAMEDTPDWLAPLGEESAESPPQQEEIQPSAEGQLPDWLSSIGEESAEEITEEPVAQDDLPDWLATLGEESSEVPSQESPQPAEEDQMPGWLSSLVEVSSLEEEAGQEIEPAEPSQPSTEEELPVWLASVEADTAETEQPVGQEETPSATAEEPVFEEETTPTFVDDEGKPISTEDVDAIFSMDMPDWLSDAEGVTDSEVTPASEEAQGDELRPAELPSWVQAMRPVESVISETEGGPVEERPLEERGPLAGLRGVLPAVPSIGPSSKPKAYSIKLQASEDQQSSAALLEQMLAEEIHPKQVGDQKVLLTQRLLRWIIALLLLLVIAVGTGTQINPIPTSVPLETSAALNYIKNTLPSDAPVLLIFDYESALAGELEATAAPVIDQMLTLKAPRLALLSSTPVGSGLAERLIGPLVAPYNHNYQRGQNFVNLGYLPGGAAGVLAFSQGPSTTKPLTTSGEAAWNTPVLQDVRELSNFSAIILLTGNVDTARPWIEQTEGSRGDTPLLVLSSAQSGPMILPYYQSGQVAGMITGLDGSAPIEQANGGRPGMARRYWDAFGFGLLAAAVMITLGSLWSLVASWQARRKEKGEA